MVSVKSKELIMSDNCNHKKAKQDSIGQIAEFVDYRNYPTCGDYLCDTCCAIVSLKNENKRLREKIIMLQDKGIK